MKSHPPVGNQRILVVEDDKHMREVLEIALGNSGYQVVTAADGAAALDLVRLMHFDLVLMDLIMPGMAGIEAIMALLAHEPGIKIIAISGAQPGDKRDFLPLAKSLGALAVLRKPFDRDHFIATVRGVITQDARRLVG
ncbi:MAG: response regulator [Opitutaceae bacterium]|nr:response regulator [Verrucomicrobiales bacterium]